MSEQEKIDIVAKATGFTERVAEEELKREGWNIDLAIYAIRAQQQLDGT